MQSETISQETSTGQEPPLITPFKALITLLGVICVYLILCHYLGVTEFWAGFLFILYWGMIDKVEVSRLPASICGGMVGLLLGFTTPLLSDMMGETAGLVFLVIVMAVIFCMLMGG